MIYTRKQKAAMLLMSLDTATASELLRDVKPETVRELAVELAYLDAAGYASTQESLEYAKEFCISLGVKERFKIKNFLRDPDKYAGAGTKMPYVFYTPDGAPRVSDAEMWIAYVTNYLMIMEKIPEPLPEEEKPEEEIDWTEWDY